MEAKTSATFANEGEGSVLTRRNPNSTHPRFTGFSHSELLTPGAQFLTPASALPARTEETQERRLSFLGTGGTLLGIHVINVLLAILTLGVYQFWGKVKVRRYLYSQADLDGDRFAYHGTGKELFLGFLKAALTFGVPFVLLQVVVNLPSMGAVLQGLAAFLTYVLFFVFSATATVGARRYRLSRTSWRGIHFSFRGHVKDMIKLFVKGALLSAITFGMYYSAFEIQRYRFLTEHSYFGSQAFRFTGENHALLRSYGKTVVLSSLWLPLIVGLFFVTEFRWVFVLLPVLPVATWMWFLAKKERYLWDHTECGDLRFRSTVTGKELLWLKLGNLLLLIFSLGLAWPWTVVRNIQFAFDHLYIEGALALATVHQDLQDSSATGEGLANFVDTDLDIGG